MKIFVKTLKGSAFDIEVKPEDTVADVKKNIETAQGVAVYPAEQQMLIHQAKVLKDNTTLDENKIVENSFVVIMLSKTKSSSGDGSTAPTAPTTKAPTTSTPASTTAPQAPTLTSAPPASAPAPALVSSVAAASDYVYGQAASSLVAGSNLEVAVQQILDMGGGTWDRDTVVHALRAAYNNPERAIEYLYSSLHCFCSNIQAKEGLLRYPRTSRSSTSGSNPYRWASACSPAPAASNTNCCSSFWWTKCKSFRSFPTGPSQRGFRCWWSRNS